MKSLPLKLGIFIVVLLGLVIIGFVLYEPLWWKWYEVKLSSDDKATREAAVEVVAGRDGAALPRVRGWLARQDGRMVDGACGVLRRWIKGDDDEMFFNAMGVLKNSDDDIKKRFLPDLEKILKGPPSGKTEIAAEIVMSTGMPDER